jgi:hypothetical protein
MNAVGALNSVEGFGLFRGSEPPQASAKKAGDKRLDYPAGTSRGIVSKRIGSRYVSGGSRNPEGH